MPSKSDLPNSRAAPLRGTWGAGGGGGAGGAASGATGWDNAAGVGGAACKMGSGAGGAGWGSGAGVLGVCCSSSTLSTLPDGLFLAAAHHLVERDVVDLNDLE